MKSIDCIKPILRLDYPRKYDQHRLNITLGKDAYEIPIDIANGITWIIPKGSKSFDMINEEIIMNKWIYYPYKNKRQYGKEVHNQCYINNDKSKTINDYQYFIAAYKPETFPQVPGHVSFGYKYYNSNHSIIDHYKKLGLINDLSFSIDINSSSLFLGGIPSEIIDKKCNASTNVLGKNYSWDYVLSEVFIANGTVNQTYEMNSNDNSDYGYFDTIHNYILGPKAFMKSLYETYFKDLLASNLCYWHLFKRDIRQLECNEHEIILMGNITFVIGDYAYTKDMKQLWKCNQGKCLFGIIENPYENNWVLGSNFYEEYQVLFDYNTSKVYFYYFRGVQLVNSVIKVQKKAISYSVFAMGVGILMLALAKYYLLLQEKNNNNNI